MLPNILDIADKHNLTFQQRSYGKKQTLAKCPFCREDEQPRKAKKFYLSLNTEEQVFRCWFCNESGGVFRFIALLEGEAEQAVTNRFRSETPRRHLHPAEQLTGSQCRLMGLGSRPNWHEIRSFSADHYKSLCELVWKAWKQFLTNEKRYAYQLLCMGIATGSYEKAIRSVQKREKEISADVLKEVLYIYSLQERPGPINRLEELALHIADPVQFPFFPVGEEELLLHKAERWST